MLTHTPALAVSMACGHTKRLFFLCETPSGSRCTLCHKQNQRIAFFLTVGHAPLSLLLGIWASFGKIPTGHFCVGRALGKFPRVTFALGELWENSHGSLLRWASFGKIPTGHFCVGRALGKFPQVTFALGELWEKSHRSLLRWAGFGKIPTSHFCVGRALGKIPQVAFALRQSISKWKKVTVQ